MLCNDEAFILTASTGKRFRLLQSLVGCNESFSLRSQCGLDNTVAKGWVLDGLFSLAARALGTSARALIKLLLSYVYSEVPCSILYFLSCPLSQFDTRRLQHYPMR